MLKNVVKAAENMRESEIMAFYFGKALASPFEVKATDEQIKEEGFRTP
jgi:hypothetical protein